MLRNLTPLLIALALAGIIHGIAGLMPDIPTDDDLAAIVPDKVIEDVQKELDAQTYIKSFPFVLSKEDQESIENKFSELAHPLARGDQDQVDRLMLEIESLVKPYWFQKSFVEGQLTFTLDDGFLLEEDTKDLKDLVLDILNLTEKDEVASLHKALAKYNVTYYESMNRLMDAYKTEVADKKLMGLRSKEEGRVQKLAGQFETQPPYTYEVFLYSRAFAMTDKDNTDLYSVFTDIADSGNPKAMEVLHKRMSPYWFKAKTLGTLIPIDLYRKTSFVALDDDQRDTLNQQYEAIVKEDLSLKKASVHAWKTLVFVHPDEKPPAFDDMLAGLEEFMGHHQPELLAEYMEKNQTYLVHCNWKLFAENYMDGYHLQYLHANTLNMYDHSKQKSRFVGPHWSFFEPLTDDYFKNLGQFGYTPIDHIPKHSIGAYVHLLFPNLGITESESTWTIMQMIPLKPNLTLLKYRAKVMPKEAKMSTWFSSKSKRPQKPIEVSDFQDPLQSMDFMIEDMYVCERVQASMESGNFKVGPMHMTKEASLTSFQQAVLDHLK